MRVASAGPESSTSGNSENHDREQRQSVNADERGRLHHLDSASERVTKQVPRKTGKNVAAQPFRERPGYGEDDDTLGSGRPYKPGRRGGKRGKKRQTRRQKRDRERQQPSELVGLDEKGLADPEQPEQQISKPEPPPGHARAHDGTAPERGGVAVRCAPSISHTSAGSVRNRTGQRKNGAIASTEKEKQL